MENRIRTCREQLDITQDELANRAGVSRQYINAIENGKQNNITLGIMTRIAEALGVKIADIFIL